MGLRVLASFFFFGLVVWDFGFRVQGLVFWSLGTGIRVGNARNSAVLEYGVRV